MKKRDQPNKRNVYSGMFLIALATLANEILLARVLSVASWYYLAYFAISLAMLGMTAGALVVYLVPERFRAETVFDSAAKAALTSAWTIAGSMLFTCLIPLLSSQGKSIMPVIGLITVSVICAIPYFFSGVAITSVLTRGGLPVGRMYAADLAGSASSCVLVLLGFTFADPYTLSLIAASVAALAAIYFSREGSSARFSKVSKFSLVALLFLAYGNGSAEFGLRPILVKGNRESVENFSYEKWNSFSRISVGGLERNRQYLWGGSPRTPGGLETDFFNMVIDGNAASWVRKFQSPHDIEALRYDVTNAAYHLGRQGTACIIGVGGGRDVQAAILFGHAKVVGVEVNPIFSELLRTRFEAFAGLANHPAVTLVTDEARSYFSRVKEPCSIIQMSLIDTWASTAAGAFSLSENALYTVEAFKVFYSRLAENGVFAVSRWFWARDVTETARIVSLATAALLDVGAKNPSQHLILVSSGNLSTLLMSKQPIASNEALSFQEKMNKLGFVVHLLPGKDEKAPIFQAILASSSRAQLVDSVSFHPMDLTPPTDDQPYFFNTLKLSNIGLDIRGSEESAYVGNLRATQYLVTLLKVLAVLVIVTILLPLILRTGGAWRGLVQDGDFLAGALYFSLIGLGFMFTEVALIQKFNLFLGHPTYSLSVILFTLILSTGAGSFLSDRVKSVHKQIALFYPIAIAAIVLFYRFLTAWVFEAAAPADMTVKVFITVIMLFPLGVALGVCFPLGIRLVRGKNQAQTPWYWALNGVFGVLGATSAVFTSIYFGISISMYIGAACYLLLTFCNVRLSQSAA